MRKTLALYLLILVAVSAASLISGKAPEQAAAAIATAAAEPEETAETVPPAKEPVTITPLPAPEPVRVFTPEEKEMLLKIGMAERGGCGCPECIALVMCTILNRAESDRFGNSIRSVLFAPEQFTPVSDGTYYTAKPNENCYDALEMVVYGWDESRGALYYEWCRGDSWHSQNLQLLFQHCDIRFYQ